LPEDFSPPIFIAIHMPTVFTAPFAKRMNDLSKLEVREAKATEIVRNCTVYIAPGGQHMSVKKVSHRDVMIEVSRDPVDAPYCPSIDHLMKSVAGVYRSKTIGVILTGMGSDGKEGMRAIHDAKGRTIVQDEQSSTIFGMPKAIIQEGFVEKVIPLSDIPIEVMRLSGCG
jgi:two-component system chemotaxis response regulator CheB